jgi:hypothetical protein
VYCHAAIFLPKRASAHLKDNMTRLSLRFETRWDAGSTMLVVMSFFFGRVIGLRLSTAKFPLLVIFVTPTSNFVDRN